MVEYNNAEILEKKIKIKGQWVKLKYTTHALERINQREKGSLICYPSTLNILKKNIISCKCEDGDKKPTEIKYKLQFKRNEQMIFILLPQEKWKVVTVYFKNKKS